MTDMEMQEHMKTAPYYNNTCQFSWPFYISDEVFVRVSSFMPEVDDRYWVSNFGKVYDEVNQGLIKPFIPSNGYWAVTLQLKKGCYINHNQHSIITTIHRLVCTAFNGFPPDPSYHVNHKNSIRYNNYYKNLEWLTPKENVAHSFLEGHRGVGENANRNIYPEETVRHICRLLEQGITDHKTICQEVFHDDVKQTYKTLIYNIHSKKFWTSVSCDYNFEVNDPKKFVFTDDQVHYICRFFQEHPELVHGAKGVTRRICREMGIDLSAISKEDAMVYKTAINNIRHHKTYLHISSQYNF